MKTFGKTSRYQRTKTTTTPMTNIIGPTTVITMKRLYAMSRVMIYPTFPLCHLQRTRLLRHRLQGRHDRLARAALHVSDRPAQPVLHVRRKPRNRKRGRRPRKMSHRPRYRTKSCTTSCASVLNRTQVFITVFYVTRSVPFHFTLHAHFSHFTYQPIHFDVFLELASDIDVSSRGLKLRVRDFLDKQAIHFHGLDITTGRTKKRRR